MNVVAHPCLGKYGYAMTFHQADGHRFFADRLDIGNADQAAVGRIRVDNKCRVFRDVVAPAQSPNAFKEFVKRHGRKNRQFDIHAVRSAQPQVRPGNTRLIRQKIIPGIPSSDIIESQIFEFTSHDGLQPKGAGSKTPVRCAHESHLLSLTPLMRSVKLQPKKRALFSHICMRVI